MKNKNIIKKRILKSFVFVVFLCGFIGSIIFARNASASLGAYAVATGVETTDPVAQKGIFGQWTDSIANWAQNFTLEKFYNETLKNAVAETFWSASSKALNTIAYDTATWIGSGGKGQKPLFVTEGWDKYLANVGDNFAGEYIATLSKQWDANLCNPSLDIKIKILGGLSGPYRKTKPTCTFTTMKKNWDAELKRPDFLNRFQNMFEPNSNDLGIALSLQTNLIEASNRKADLAKTELVAKKGWLDVRNIAGVQQGMPTTDVKDYELQKDAFMRSSLMTKTTATFADAVNVFLNQLASTLFTRMLKKLTGAPASSPYTGDYGGLVNYSSGGGSGGAEAAKEQFRKIMEPDFTVRGDYDVLAELTMCPDPTKAGPTNCVITDKFRQAIADRMTVGEAMKQKYLNPEAVFGFTTDGLEPKYNEAYPYRSMIILRKFRILPVGWEVAAQYIKNHSTSDIYNLKKMVDCFSNDDKDYNSYYADWCKGLVDPNWVLKAPLNYCKKEGFGPEILSESITGEGEDSKLTISRNNNYCADEQSCVREKADGSCDVYGYCTEEKRKWNFGSNSCEPVYNTCQTFRSRQGNTVSYLQNGLDYTNCSANAVGCKEYALGTSNSDEFYASASNTIKWSLSKASSTFNKNLADCDAKGEGCHELIRTEMNNGANLFGGFEDLFGATTDATAAFGDKSVKLTHDVATTVPAFKIDVDLKGYYYTFSVSAKNCGTNGVIEIGDSSTSYSSSTLKTTDQWQRFAVSHYFDKANESNLGRVWIGVIGIATSTGCSIDGVKVEKNNNPTTFSDYTQAGVIYEKLLPNYLEYVCYTDPGSNSKPNYSLKSTAPAICNSFARKCNDYEVGCKMFTAVSDNMTIPASVIPTDYCDASCVGYDEYLQSESAFDSRRSAYLIPKKTKTCGAEAVGCDGFTNLDKVGSSTQKEKINQYGAENIEYYSELKQCVKKDDGACAEFYTWEGSSETGFQLKVYQLKGNNAANPNEIDPALTSDTLYNGKTCASSTYGNLNNPMCFEFYNKAGHVSYKFLPYTISCSDDCHPYRRTAVNIDVNIKTQVSCGGIICSDIGADKKDKCWDAVLNNCNVCLNGGKWSVEGQACIYDAIPGEGKTCAANQDGCREYNGNSGANVQTVLQSDFEGSTDNWRGLPGTQAIPDSESLKSGENSLMATSTSNSVGISYDVSGIAKQGKSYHLAFLAKGKSSLVDKFTNIYFDSGVASSSLAVNSVIKAEWTLYELNLTSLDHEITPDEKLIIKANGDFFIDNIILTEITDRYYLIKDSSVIPDVCNNDIFGSYRGPEYNLGCAEYSAQSDSNKHYLRQFTSLCQESAIGCEMMVDTHNSSSTLDDNISYVVYNKDKECTSEEKGCERMGEAYSYASGTVEKLYTDVYKINDPNNSQAECTASQIGCEEWSADEGISTNYFKDPFDMTCEWRQKASTTDFGWYRKKISRCGGVANGHVCKSDKDCSSGLSDAAKKCELYNTDVSCSVDDRKTIGYGSTGGGAVYQPNVDASSSHWIGNCPTSQSTCTEYIDPVSSFSSNVIFNGDFSQNVDAASNTIADGWGLDKKQSVPLEPYTLYTFSVKSKTVFAATITGDNLTSLNEDNLFASGGGIPLTASGNTVSKSFYSNGSDKAIIQVDSVVANDSGDNIVSLKKSLVDYQLSKDVNKDECNGFLNPDKGCVLFNERKKERDVYNNLIYDADTSSTTPSGISGQNDSNVLLKVSPDRTCDKWLACKSHVKDENGNNVCYSVVLCNSFDENGNCNNFIISKENNQQMSSANYSKYQNVSGYAEVDIAGNPSKKDMLPLAVMKQDGGMSMVSNGSFERYDENRYPPGWSPVDAAWSKQRFSVINNPVAAQAEGVSYLGRGQAFLKFSPAAGPMQSEFVDVEPDSDYYLSMDVNTLILVSDKNLPLDFLASVGFYNSAGKLIATSSVATLPKGSDWQQVIKKFHVNRNIYRIKVILSQLAGAAQGPSSGNVFVDNVAIRPVLNNRKAEAGGYDAIFPTCRLYPKSDSLSCEYYEDSGIKQKGRYGYCLEYDRYPGNPNACLLWYPVDRVRGDWEENLAGYKGKAPVLYSTDGEATKVYEYRHVFLAQTWSTEGCQASACYNGGMPGYTAVEVQCSEQHGNDPSTCVCEPDGNHIVKADGSDRNYTVIDYDCNDNEGSAPPADLTSPGDGWYAYNGDIRSFGASKAHITASNPYAKYLCPGGATTCQLSEELFRSKVEVTKVAQTVTTTWQNKYWAARVYQGSPYETVFNHFTYGTKNPPFGSIAFTGGQGVFYTGNPPSWESVLSTDNPENPVNMGQIYSCNGGDNCNFIYNKPSDNFPYQYYSLPHVNSNAEIKRLFAQSYGTWEWNNVSKHYEATTSDWIAPTSICAGNPSERPDYSGSNSDLCGIPPRVENLRVNKSLCIGSGIVGLSYNAIVDSQQLPLVMYVVDWGDGSSDTVSGIEMMPKMASSSPHILYYLYDYWDLKAKSTSVATVHCADAGESIYGVTAPASDYCIVKPRVKLKDNWGWCTEGGDAKPCVFDDKKCVNKVTGATTGACTSNYDCSSSEYCNDGYYEYSGWIMVTRG